MCARVCKRCVLRSLGGKTQTGGPRVEWGLVGLLTGRAGDDRRRPRPRRRRALSLRKADGFQPRARTRPLIPSCVWPKVLLQLQT
jgi:hypothetical protein